MVNLHFKKSKKEHRVWLLTPNPLFFLDLSWQKHEAWWGCLYFQLLWPLFIQQTIVNFGLAMLFGNLFVYLSPAWKRHSLF